MSRFRFISTLRSDRRGAVAVEFALWATLFFGVIVVAIDFALYLTYTSRLGSAVQQASIITYNNRANATLASQSTFIDDTADLPGTAVQTTMTCNGGAQSCAAAPAARVCACVSGTSTYTASASCGAVCPSGATSGFYVTLKADYTYRAIVSANGALNGKAMSQSATVRLK